MDRKLVQKFLNCHYEFHMPISQIGAELGISPTRAHLVITTSWTLGTTSAPRIAKEM